MSATRRELLATIALAGRSDAAIVSELLVLERRSAAMWEALERLPEAHAVAEQEAEHAQGLTRALKGMGRRPPADDGAAPPVRTAAAALRFEERVIGAYSRALGEVSNRRLLLPLASIAANHGQHLVILRRALGHESLTRAFEPVE